MKFLIIGCGSIGKRHLRNLLTLGDEVEVCEPSKDRTNEIIETFKVKVYQTLDEALEQNYDAALITNPNIYHLSSAVKAAQAGCHLFIEKPLSHSVEGVDELISIVESKNLKSLIGCNWKFHPTFKRMKEIIESNVIGKVLSFNILAGWYLPEWHPMEDYRKGYSANRSLGGGVLLDSHEFDYIQWFLGAIKKIVCLTGKYSNLEIDTEDMAELVVELENKIIGGIHIDYLRRPCGRNYYFFGEEGTLEWSFKDKKISLFTSRSNEWQDFAEDPDYNINEMYQDEMRHFKKVLNGEEESMTDVYKARQILQVIELAKKSSKLEEFIYETG